MRRREVRLRGGHGHCVSAVIFTDSPGALTCACNAGYVGPGGQWLACANIDACTVNPRGANAKCTHKVPPALGNAAGAAGRTCACVTGYNGNAETGCSITDECNVTMSHNRSAGMAHAAAWQPQWGLLFAHATWVTWAAELTILQKTRVVIFCVKSTLLFAPICRLRRWTRLQAYARVWRGDRRRP